MKISKKFIVKRVDQETVTAYDFGSDQVYSFKGPIALLVTILQKIENLPENFSEDEKYLIKLKDEMRFLDEELSEEVLLIENLILSLEYLVGIKFLVNE